MTSRGKCPSHLLVAVGIGYASWAFFTVPFLYHMASDYILTEWRADSWLVALPGLNKEGLPSVGMYAHWCGGFIVMVLSFIQPLGPVRRRWPAFHRACGHIFCLAALLTAAGGLLFTWSSLPELTVGGWNMNIAFSVYGIALGVCAFATWRYARARELERHRNWSIRLWAQANASLLYRLYYALLFAAGYAEIKSAADFHRPVDSLLDWYARPCNVAPCVARRAREVPERAPSLPPSLALAHRTRASDLAVGTRVLPWPHLAGRLDSPSWRAC
jgi:membrane protein implicated in regulation of membrane protease activity